MPELSIHEVTEKLDQVIWTLEDVHDDLGEAEDLKSFQDTLKEDLRELGMREEPER